MARLRLYINDQGRCVLHQSGFSWYAAVASLVWALQRRLYLLAAVLFVLEQGVFLVVESRLGGAGQLALVLLVCVFNGAIANPLHRVLLERAGWRVSAEESTPAGGAVP